MEICGIVLLHDYSSEESKESPGSRSGQGWNLIGHCSGALFVCGSRLFSWGHYLSLERHISPEHASRVCRDSHRVSPPFVSFSAWTASLQSHPFSTPVGWVGLMSEHRRKSAVLQSWLCDYKCQCRLWASWQQEQRGSWWGWILSQLSPLVIGQVRYWEHSASMRQIGREMLRPHHRNSEQAVQYVKRRCWGALIWGAQFWQQAMNGVRTWRGFLRICCYTHLSGS